MIRDGITTSHLIRIIKQYGDSEFNNKHLTAEEHNSMRVLFNHAKVNNYVMDIRKSNFMLNNNKLIINDPFARKLKAC